MAGTLAVSEYPRVLLAVLGVSLQGRKRHPDAIVDQVEAAVRAGFPSSVLGSLQDLGVSIAAVAAATGINVRTLYRRLSAGEALDPVESDRILRLAIVIGTIEVWEGSYRAAVRWLADQDATAHGAPLGRLDTEAGCEYVIDTYATFLSHRSRRTADVAKPARRSSAGKKP